MRFLLNDASMALSISLPTPSAVFGNLTHSLESCALHLGLEYRFRGHPVLALEKSQNQSERHGGNSCKLQRRPARLDPRASMHVRTATT